MSKKSPSSHAIAMTRLGMLLDANGRLVRDNVRKDIARVTARMLHNKRGHNPRLAHNSAGLATSWPLNSKVS